MKLGLVSRGSIDLDLTLYVSLSLPMFKKNGECWVKTHGFGAGTRVCADRNLRCYGSYCSNQFLAYVVGLWIDKEKGLEELEGAAREIAEELVKEFYCLSISASPWDTFEVLTSAFLSRNTDYHKNTVRWVRAFLSKLGDFRRDDLAHITRAAVSTYREFKSYQLQQFIEVLESLHAIAHAAPTIDPGTIRKKLLEVKYLGPKVADSFILHSGLDQSKAPVDVHYMRFLKRHGLLEKEYKSPQKNYCAKYECSSCLIARKCIYTYAARMFKRLNGFVQTAAYAMGKLGIKRCEDLEKTDFRIKISKVITSL